MMKDRFLPMNIFEISEDYEINLRFVLPPKSVLKIELKTNDNNNKNIMA